MTKELTEADLTHEQNARLSTSALVLIESIVQVTSDASKGHLTYEEAVARLAGAQAAIARVRLDRAKAISAVEQLSPRSLIEALVRSYLIEHVAPSADTHVTISDDDAVATVIEARLADLGIWPSGGSSRAVLVDARRMIAARIDGAADDRSALALARRAGIQVAIEILDGYIRAFGSDEGVVVRGGPDGDYLGEVDPERVR
jgi:hypothetical protein